MNGAAPPAIAGRQQRAAAGGAPRCLPLRSAPAPPMAAGRRAPPEPGGGPVLLQGIFGAGPAPGAAACSLSLTARELQVRRAGGCSGGSAGPDAALRLADCVGSAAFPAAAAAACFSLVCYPLRGPRWGPPSRQRLERTFRVSRGPDAEGNLRIAQAWSRRIRELAVPAVPAQDGECRAPSAPPGTASRGARCAGAVRGLGLGSRSGSLRRRAPRGMAVPQPRDGCASAAGAARGRVPGTRCGGGHRQVVTRVPVGSDTPFPPVPPRLGGTGTSPGMVVSLPFHP